MQEARNSVRNLMAHARRSRGLADRALFSLRAKQAVEKVLLDDDPTSAAKADVD
jgi:hypothetical protein